MRPDDPVEVGHGHHELAESAFSVWPVLGLVLFLLLVTVTAWILWRRGLIRIPRIMRTASPEDQAKQVLAARFAHGDIDTEEFLERASTLNWAPGVEPAPPRRRIV